ncbi:hypothetical protein OAN61_00565, partial [bacterium]|nr:hypothetical protein [bacterium]
MTRELLRGAQVFSEGNGNEHRGSFRARPLHPDARQRCSICVWAEQQGGCAILRLHACRLVALTWNAAVADGTPKGYVQLLDSPGTAHLLHMSINTRNPDG